MKLETEIGKQFSIAFWDNYEQLKHKEIQVKNVMWFSLLTKITVRSKNVHEDEMTREKKKIKEIN